MPFPQLLSYKGVKTTCEFCDAELSHDMNRNFKFAPPTLSPEDRELVCGACGLDTPSGEPKQVEGRRFEQWREKHANGEIYECKTTGVFDDGTEVEVEMYHQSRGYPPGISDTKSDPAWLRSRDKALAEQQGKVFQEPVYLHCEYKVKWRLKNGKVTGYGTRKFAYFEEAFRSTKVNVEYQKGGWVWAVDLSQ